MTPDEARRRWLEQEMRKVPWIINAPKHGEHQCDWSSYECPDHFVPDYSALAALVDAPLRAMEEALTHILAVVQNAKQVMTEDNHYEDWGQDKVKALVQGVQDGLDIAALARLPWREKEKG